MNYADTKDERGANMPTSIIGKRFGSLEVISTVVTTDRRHNRTLFVCKCDCGSVDYRTEKYNLTNGKVVSCGCKNAHRLARGRGSEIDLVGQRFGRLVVTSPAGFRDSIRSGRRRRLWACVCDCGNTLGVTVNDLRGGNTRSCGCFLQEVTRTANGISMVNRYRRLALKAGKVWAISDDEALRLISQDCSYCGAAPTIRSGHKYLKRNGIDRVDSNKGYEPGNVVTCCKQCNVSKNDYSLDQFKTWAFRLAEHLKKGSN